MTHRRILMTTAAAVLLLLLSVCCAAAETAEEITAGCSFTNNGKTKDCSTLTDGDYSTYLPFKEKKGELLIKTGEPAAGLYVKLYNNDNKPLSYDVQVPGENGEWVTAAQGGGLLVHWHALENPVTEMKIVCTSKERLRIAELKVYGPGDKPAEVQVWNELEKCDLMLLSTHPDDELLWFGGLLPTYAGDRGLRVQLTVMVPTGTLRRLELLDAIWHCGVTAYPDFLFFVDNRGKSVANQYERWRGKSRVIGRVVESIRHHQPEVIVTHGEKGEYGHMAHRTTADAAKNAVKVCGNASKYKESAKKYGAWQVKKLYLHEYAKNPVICDWDEPLKAFGGKTGFDVAEEAFRFHASQVKRDWEFSRRGEHDNAAFGLYYTEVGTDTGTGDLMEHIGTAEP